MVFRAFILNKNSVFLCCASLALCGCNKEISGRTDPEARSTISPIDSQGFVPVAKVTADKTTVLHYNVGKIYASEGVSTVQLPLWVKCENPDGIEFGPISTSCSCSKATIDKAKISLGDRALVVLTIDTRNRSGNFNTSASIPTQGTEQLSYDLRVSAEIVRPASFSSSQLNLGNQEPGSTYNGKCDITIHQPISCRAPVLESLTYSLSQSSLSAAAESPRLETTIDGYEIWSIPVKFRLSASGTPGFYSEELHAHVIVGGEPIHASLPISWMTSAPVFATPAVAFLGKIPLNGKIERHITLKSVRQAPFSITSITSDHHYVKCGSTADGLDQVIDVSLIPSADRKVGPIAGHIVAKCSFGDGTPCECIIHYSAIFVESNEASVK